MMHVIEISLTELCDRHCPYCVARKRREPSVHSQSEKIELEKSGQPYKYDSEMRSDWLKDWLAFQKNHLENMKLVITGGEPTTHPEWISLLEWIKDNEFGKPLLYTNGFGIKDLFQNYRAKELCNVILTHHGDERSTRLSTQILKELNMKFVVKILVGMESDIVKLREFGESLDCETVFEGIKKISESVEETAESLKTMNPLKDENPYYWRYEGYGDKIARDRIPLPWDASILTIVPVGQVFNCHHFHEPSIGSIEHPSKLENLNPAGCVYLDTLKLEYPNPYAETHCELLHYVLKYLR